MRQNRAFKEALSSFIATVFPTDTLLRALREMERHQVRMLGVVGEGGGLLGLVSEAHILAAWGEDPLSPVSRVMARVKPPPRERPRLRLLRFQLHLPRLRRKSRGPVAPAPGKG
ncbi:CBS domain-containing protein [Pyxidicoccus sp. MSG2]|nr:CBS domain-containing protein [Pyxidicoccus sp. MSG2]